MDRSLVYKPFNPFSVPTNWTRSYPIPIRRRRKVCGKLPKHLAQYLGNKTFWDIETLSQRLTIFYEKYNNVRLHGSIASIMPGLFWEIWDKDMIKRKEYENNKWILFENSLSAIIGYWEFEGGPLHKSNGSRWAGWFKKWSVRAESLQQPSV